MRHYLSSSNKDGDQVRDVINNSRHSLGTILHQVLSFVHPYIISLVLALLLQGRHYHDPCLQPNGLKLREMK